jgi:peptidyl-prolyl cis-trans isomerase B (cyclophilin B)
MSKRLLPLLLLVAAVALTGCNGDDDDKAIDDSGSSSTSSGTPKGSADPADVTCDYPADAQGPAAKEVDPPPAKPTVGGDVPVTFHTNLGDFTATLDAAKAPCTVNSFVSLATQGYYDDSPCPRFSTLEEQGYAIAQCGDPSGTGAGGPGYTFADELDGNEAYTAGVLAMANRGPDTNGSQFFINYGDSGFPQDYTVFGSFDLASLKPLEDLAAKGTVQLDSGMSGPTEPITIESISFP